MYNELGHYFLVLGIFIVLTYNKRPTIVSFYFFFLPFPFLVFCFAIFLLTFLITMYLPTQMLMRLYSIKSHKHGLIMRVVCYYGVGFQVFMDLFLVIRLDPAIFQNKGAAKIYFFFVDHWWLFALLFLQTKYI